MREVIKEWGGVILSVIAFIALIGVVVTLKPTINSAFSETLEQFSNQMDEALDTQLDFDGATEAPTDAE